MTNNEKYNGYNNYETWLVALWIDNDQCYSEDVQTLARQYAGDSNRYASALKEYVEDMPDVSKAIETGGMVADLVNSTLSDVDWYELATMYMDEYYENQENDEREE